VNQYSHLCPRVDPQICGKGSPSLGSPVPAAKVERRLAAIVAMDVVGYTRLMERDEAGTLIRLKTLRREVFDPAIAARSARTVKLMGDGALMEFASAVEAVTCAIDIQKLVHERNIGDPASRRIQFRIGINVGDIIVDGDDIYGDSVNVAARIEALAEPGTIDISHTTADQVRNKIPVQFESRGQKTFKNIARTIEVFRVFSEGDDDLRIRHRPDAPSQPLAMGRPSIAVLAFNNMSTDAEQEHFSDGISEDIMTDLSKLAGLHVVARNSSFTFKRRATFAPDIARELGVRYVLEGSVRRADGRVRITAQLIDAWTGGHVWADRFDRNLTDIFKIQDEVTQEIVAALKVKLTAEEQDQCRQEHPADTEASREIGNLMGWLGDVVSEGNIMRPAHVESRRCHAHSDLGPMMTNDQCCVEPAAANRA